MKGIILKICILWALWLWNCPKILATGHLGMFGRSGAKHIQCVNEQSWVNIFKTRSTTINQSYPFIIIKTVKNCPLYNRWFTYYLQVIVHSYVRSPEGVSFAIYKLGCSAASKTVTIAGSDLSWHQEQAFGGQGKSVAKKAPECNFHHVVPCSKHDSFSIEEPPLIDGQYTHGT